MSEMYARAFVIVEDIAEMHPLEYWPSQNGPDEYMCKFCEVCCYVNDPEFIHSDNCVWLRSTNIMDYE